MIVHKKFIFGHLTKTGGTFIRQYLRNNIRDCVIDVGGVRLEKHGPLMVIAPFVLQSRFKFGYIRNPLDFYISLWASNITPRATRNRPRRRIWFKNKEVKTNPNKFIKFLIDEETKNIRYFNFPLMHKLDIGVLTYRYLHMYYDHAIFKDRKWEKRHKKYKLVDKVLRFEDGLAETLFKTFKQKNILIDKKQRKQLFALPPKNESKHKYYLDYYDKETIDFVKHKDRFIFKLHYPGESNEEK